MINKIKTLILLAAGSFLLMFGVFASHAAASGFSSINAIQNGACGASGVNSTDCSSSSSKANSSINGVIKRVINIFSVVGGIVVVIMIAIGGFRYATSGGNEQAIATAKKTLMYALIGLVIIVLAQVVAKFALHEVSTAANSGTSGGTGGTGGTGGRGPGGP